MEPELPMENNQFQQPRTPSSKPLFAGILLILSGLMGFYTAAMLLAMDTDILITYLPSDIPITAEQLQSFLLVCGAVIGILSVFALTGGIFAVKRRAWGLAILGSVLGLFVIGPAFIASVLSLVALILLALSRKDFL